LRRVARAAIFRVGYDAGIRRDERFADSPGPDARFQSGRQTRLNAPGRAEVVFLATHALAGKRFVLRRIGAERGGDCQQ
jgi:hypothetical protein